MLLREVRDDGEWIISQWTTTYPMSWKQILKACEEVYDYYDQLQILVEDTMLEALAKRKFGRIPENANLTFRGLSKIVGVPLMITMYNQTESVRVVVAKATKEFEEADYKKLNLSLGQYLDSIELAMHR